MNGVFERFVSQVVKQTDGNTEERKDLSEELLSHLYCASEDLQNEGYTKDEAVKMAMANFGVEKEVGRQLQHAMYPYRREMMLGLASTSLLFIYGTYLLQLFTRGNAEIVWLCLSVFVSVSILMTIMHPVAALQRRLILNSLLIGHILFMVYGAILVADLDSPYTGTMVVFSIVLVVFSIILVYRTTIYDFPSTAQPFPKDAKVLHFINITIGILLAVISLFLLWVFMAFVTEQQASLLLIAIPLVIWVCLYALQLRILAARRRKSAYSMMAFQLLWIIAAIVIFITGK